MDLEITFGVPKNQKVRVAKIIYEAFENKFENIFGPKKQSIPLISKHLRNNRIVVAIREGIVVGVGGLEFKGKRFFDVSFWQLLRELKFGIFRVMFLGWIFYNKVEEKELLVDALAVARNIRGKGIGSKLINFIIDFARSRGYEQVKLFVIDANEKAKKLYERIGFKKVKAHRIPLPWNRIFGFNRTSEMTYRI